MPVVMHGVGTAPVTQGSISATKLACHSHKCEASKPVYATSVKPANHCMAWWTDLFCCYQVARIDAVHKCRALACSQAQGGTAAPTGSSVANQGGIHHVPRLPHQLHCAV